MSNNTIKQENDNKNELETKNVTDTLKEIQSLKETIEKQIADFKSEKEQARLDNEKIISLLDSQKKVLSTPEDTKKDKAEAQRTADALNKEKILIKIPIDPQNPKDVDVYVQINGYPWIIKRGESVKVPVEVAKILEKAKYI